MTWPALLCFSTASCTPCELQCGALTLLERQHGAFQPYGEGVPMGCSHPSCHAAAKQLPWHKIVCEEKRSRQALVQG